MSADNGCVENPELPCCDHAKRDANKCRKIPVCVKLNPVTTSSDIFIRDFSNQGQKAAARIGDAQDRIVCKI